jgi:signal peptidase I
MKKILSVIGNVLLVIVILIAVAMTFASLNTNDKGLPEIGGFIVMNIQSGSMEPAIKTGDLIITKTVKKPYELKVGDVVSYVGYENKDLIIITHRITSVVDEGGAVSYVTKGDNNPTVDEVEVTPSSIVSKYDGIRIPVLGTIFSFLSGRVGFFICIVLPLFILFVYQIYKFISTIMEEKKKELIEQIRKEQAKGSQV